MHRFSLLLIGVAAAPAPLMAQTPSDTIAIREWTVPWEGTRPRDPSVDPQGRIWFVGQSGNYVARFDLTTEKFERFEIEPGTNPHTVVVDRTGNAWYTGNRNGRLGRIDARTGEIKTFMMPDPTARDPHTIAFNAGGEIWFTLQNSNMVGRFNPADGQTRLVTMKTPRSRPYGIVVDRNNIPWYDMFGTNKIGTIDPATMEPREITLPWADARPRRIALTSDGTVWYGDYVRGTLGRLNPITGKVDGIPPARGAHQPPLCHHVRRSGPNLGGGDGDPAQPIRGLRCQDREDHQHHPGTGRCRDDPAHGIRPPNRPDLVRHRQQHHWVRTGPPAPPAALIASVRNATRTDSGRPDTGWPLPFWPGLVITHGSTAPPNSPVPAVCGPSGRHQGAPCLPSRSSIRSTRSSTRPPPIPSTPRG